jgi:hypothetical protein
MGTIYNYAKSIGLIQPSGFTNWAGVANGHDKNVDLSFINGGSINWSAALIDSGKAVSQITLQNLTADEVNAIVSKLDVLFGGVANTSVVQDIKSRQFIANMIAEELPNIIATVQLVKWQTQSAFGGILAQGTQLDIWPIRAKDVGGIILSNSSQAASGNATGLYANTSMTYTWMRPGLVAGVAQNIIPTQTMWQYGGMVYLGGMEREPNPIIEGIQFTLASIAAPAQPVTRNIKDSFNDNNDMSVFRLEKPVIIPPLKQQLVQIMPADSGDTNFEFIGFVVAQSQNKSL